MFVFGINFYNDIHSTYCKNMKFQLMFIWLIQLDDHDRTPIFWTVSKLPTKEVTFSHYYGLNVVTIHDQKIFNTWDK